MIYHLSGRQRKELRNGKTLQIALPAPPGGTEDPLGYARRVLPSPHVRAAEVLLLSVDVLSRLSGMGAVFGRLLREGATAPLTVEIECVVVTLAEDRRQRSRYPIQWPGAVELDDGRRLPEE